MEFWFSGRTRIPENRVLRENRVLAILFVLKYLKFLLNYDFFSFYEIDHVLQVPCCKKISFATKFGYTCYKSNFSVPKLDFLCFKTGRVSVTPAYSLSSDKITTLVASLCLALIQMLYTYLQIRDMKGF